MPQEIEYSANFDFDDGIGDQWKINREGAVDEWVWLNKLNGQTLTTSSVSAASVVNDINQLTEASLTFGDNPIHYYNASTPGYDDRVWALDAYNNIKTSTRYSSTGIGYNFNYRGQFYGNYNYALNTGEGQYGCDFMVAVNHGTQKAVFIWLRWAHWSGNPMSFYKQKSSDVNTIYYELAKFM